MEADLTKGNRLPIRLLTPDEAASDDLLSFLKTLFKTIDQERWLWEYKNCIHPSSVFLSEYGGKIIVHYAIIGLPFMLSGKRVIGGKAEASIANLKSVARLPNDIKKDVFLNTVKHALNHTSNKGRAFVFGFPSKTAVPAQLGAGYDLVKVPLVCASRYVTLSPFVSKYRDKGFVRIVEQATSSVIWTLGQLVYRREEGIREISPQDRAGLSLLSETFSALNPSVLMIDATYEYLKWRFVDNLNHPSKVYVSCRDGQVTGVVAVGIHEQQGGGRGLKVHHMTALDDQTACKLIRHVRTLAYTNKVGAIRCWTQKSITHKQLNKALSKSGFLMRKSSKLKDVIFFSRNSAVPASHDSWFFTSSWTRE